MKVKFYANYHIYEVIPKFQWESFLFTSLGFQWT